MLYGLSERVLKRCSVPWEHVGREYYPVGSRNSQCVRIFRWEVEDGQQLMDWSEGIGIVYQPGNRVLQKKSNSMGYWSLIDARQDD